MRGMGAKADTVQQPHFGALLDANFPLDYMSRPINERGTYYKHQGILIKHLEKQVRINLLRKAKSGGKF